MHLHPPSPNHILSSKLPWETSSSHAHTGCVIRTAEPFELRYHRYSLVGDLLKDILRPLWLRNSLSTISLWVPNKLLWVIFSQCLSHLKRSSLEPPMRNSNSVTLSWHRSVRCVQLESCLLNYDTMSVHCIEEHEEDIFELLWSRNSHYVISKRLNSNHRIFFVLWPLIRQMGNRFLNISQAHSWGRFPSHFNQKNCILKCHGGMIRILRHLLVSCS